MEKIKPSPKILISLLVFAIVIFTVDYLFLRHLFWERLVINVAIFLVYLVVFIKFLKD